MKAILLARSLGCGGTERQIAYLARGLAAKHELSVFAFYGAETFSFGQDLQSIVEFVDLQKKGRWDVFGFLFRFLRSVRQVRPDVIYAFLTVPSIIAVLAKLAYPPVRIVWGVRASNMDLSRYGFVVRAARMMERAASKHAHLIISNSQAGKTQVASEKFKTLNVTVIPNGIDITMFKPDASCRSRFRKHWGVQSDQLLIGIVARHDPMKGYELYIRAAARLLGRRKDVKFAAVGDDSSAYSESLKALAKSLNVESQIVWVGRVADTHQVYAAFDIYTSASVFGEGFSNSIAEAMACGVPAVVTDVGDSAMIVGDTGVVVKPNDSDALAQGWEEMLSLRRASPDVGERARARIVDRFSVEKMIAATEEALLSQTR